MKFIERDLTNLKEQFILSELEETYKNFESSIETGERNTEKYSLFPIENRELYDFYEKQRDMFWVTQEIDFSNDRVMWDNLSGDEKEFITFVLSFFAQADGIVMENLSSNFQEEIDIKEAKAFYAMQNAMEAIHNETYSTMIDVVFRDEIKKERIFDSIKHCPQVRRLAAWVFHWMDRKYNVHTRLFAFACFEGIFFSSAGFCPIRWLGRKNVLPGFCQANELISRDEKLHLDFAVCLLKKLNVKEHLPIGMVKLMVNTSFFVLRKFVEEALKVHLIGLTSEGIMEYAKCCYDYLTDALGYGKFFNATNPFPWMMEMGMANKTNFFEQKVTEYAKVSNTSFNFVRTENY